MKLHEKHVVRLFGVLTVVVALLLTPGLSPTRSAYAKDKVVSQESSKLLGKFSDALAEVAEVARPAVVNISTTSTVTMEDNPFGNMFNDPFFRHFFGDQFDHGQKRKFKSSALGSGVIISADGYILTNNHVVKGADEIKVILYDKREFKGKIVGTDPRTDLAVVKIQAKDLPTIKIGQSSKLKTGDIVLAIGNPFGLNQTITMGIVSAVGRSNIGLADFEDFIQTDAAINPGNSGGPLLNWHGEVIGINTMIASSVGQSAGIGFAIPINTAKAVLNDLVTLGRVRRPALGVRTMEIGPELANQMGLAADYGLLIVQVVPGGSADRAGLRGGNERAYLGNIPIMLGGDLIVAIDGQDVQDQQSLSQIMNSHRAGDTVRVTIYRGKRKMDINVSLGEAREQV